MNPSGKREEYAWAETNTQRKVTTVQAVSAFAQRLLLPTASEVERYHLLAMALHELLGTSDVGMVNLTRNGMHPELGLCAYLVADSTAATPPANATSDELASVGDLVRQQQQMPSLGQIFPYSMVPGDLYEQLAAGISVSGSVADLYATTPLLRDRMLESGYRSVYVFPIHIRERWWGCFSFSDGERTQVWGEDEILLLGTAADILTSAIQRWEAEDQLRVLNNQLQAMVTRRTDELNTTVGRLRAEVVERERAEAVTSEMVATLDRRLAVRTAELAAFFDLTLLAGQAVELRDVFAQVLPRIVDVTRSEAISIYLLDAKRTGLQLAGQLNLPADQSATLALGSLAPAFQRWMAQPSDSLLTSNLPALTALPSELAPAGWQTYLGSQIKVGTDVEGVLSCYRTSDRGFGLDEVALVTALAEQIGMMLATQRLRQSARALAVVEERQRLARDLHDSVSQSLFSLTLFAQAGREAAEDGDTGRLAQSLNDLEQITVQALREMRLLLYELRPADLEQDGLVAAIQRRLARVESRTGLELELQLDELPRLPQAAEVELYQVIVEALNNVVKHAAASRVQLRLSEDERYARVVLQDDGRGFDPQQATGGLGLITMRERVDRLGGQLTIASAPGMGTRLELIIPYTGSDTQCVI